MLDASQHETPTSWDRRKIKFHLSGFFGGGTPSKYNLDYWTDGTVPWVTPKDMKRRMIDTAEDLITVDAVKNSATNMVPPSSVLMVVRSGILKHSLPIALNTVPVALNQDIKAFRFRRSLLPEFFAYWIEGQQKKKLLEWCQIGATVDNIDMDAMLNGQIAVPDLATQRQIADFLDRETARIDLLIEKKQRLVALWNERINAEVSGIVFQTDRLDGDLVETGVDWLGRIPSSWQLSRIGWELQRITYGFTNPMPTEDEGPFLLTANDVNYGRILWESARHTSQHAFDHDLTDKSRPRKGDVLLTKDGTLGRVAIHDGRPVCINQSVALLRPRKNRVTSEFLANVLLSRRYQDRMVFEAGGTTIKHIYITRLQKMPFPVPTMDEQRAINAKINLTRQRVALLDDKINASIDRLKEYRSALITAAVTGQINVETYTKSGTPARRLDAIQEEMGS
ncbi:restriction endonuclease subunit S [Roseovarius ramblicola]|uniref:Restriction endonuclease subunit S n=1 Tax=Roseovarius ramblicola TaxID=2022336 RepID=A0ABV5HX22_9RHOB